MDIAWPLNLTSRHLRIHDQSWLRQVSNFQNGDFEQMKDPLGLVDNKTATIIAMTGEFICPMLVAIGFLTRLAVIPTIVVMGTAAFVAHKADPWFMSAAGNGKEPAMLFLIPFLALLFTGAGRYSVDGLLWRRRETTPTF